MNLQSTRGASLGISKVAVYKVNNQLYFYILAMNTRTLKDTATFTVVQKMKYWGAWVA